MKMRVSGVSEVSAVNELRRYQVRMVPLIGKAEGDTGIHEIVMYVGDAAVGDYPIGSKVTIQPENQSGRS